MISGQMVCENAGSPLQFPSLACNTVRITALPSNTGLVAIGGAPNQRIPGQARPTNGPVAASGSAAEGDLFSFAGETRAISVTDLSDLWIDAAVDGEGVAWNVLG